jgi:uncharacterized membrane protein YiaA
MFITYLSIISGVIAVSLIVYISLSKALDDKTTRMNSNGYYTMRIKSFGKVLIYFTFIASIMAFILGIFDTSLGISDKLMIYFLGLFFVLLGIFLIAVTVKNRIEYSDKDMRLYDLFKKNPKIIRWDDSIEIKFHEMGPFLEFSSNKSNRIFVNFRNNGFIDFVNFSLLKVSDENYELLKIIFDNK